jgi:uncharacterized protein (TIRG00374 family)
MPTNNTHETSLHAHIISGKKFKVVLLVVLLSILGYFLFTIWAGWDNVWDAIKRVGPLGIGTALGLSLINTLLRFLRWHYFLHTLGYSIPWLTSMRIFYSGFSLTTTPGKTGEALKGVLLKDYQVPFRKSFGAFLAERTSDLLAVSLLASTGLWLYPTARPVIILVFALVAAIFIFLQREAWIKAGERLAKKIFPERFAHVVEYLFEIVLSLRSCFSTKVLGISLLLGLAAWTIEAGALWFLTHLLGFHLGFAEAVFIYSFSLVVGGITLLPGGLGGAEVTMLQLLILQSIPAAAAVAITLVIRLTSLWFTVLLGMIVLPKDKILWRSKP